MKALVISGGGSKGAFAGGVAEFLIESKQKQYDLFVGSSTGSLLIPLMAANKISVIKKIFTSATQQSIFNFNPFGFMKVEEKYKLHISYLRLMKRILFERPTFGESKNLRKLIENSFTEQDFQATIATSKEVIVTVSNLNCEEVEYKSNLECSYRDFCDWTWASANVVPFMSLMQKNENYYADGGLGMNIPIGKAIEKGAKEIDVIVLIPEKRKNPGLKINNVVQLSSSIITFMTHEIARQNLENAELEAEKKGVKINKWFVPRLLTGNYLVFDPIEMEKWWEEGYAYAKSLDENIRNEKTE